MWAPAGEPPAALIEGLPEPFSRGGEQDTTNGVLQFRPPDPSVGVGINLHDP